MASGKPERQTSAGGPDWALRPSWRRRWAPANDNLRPRRSPDGRQRLVQTLLLALATAAIVFLALGMR